MKSQVAAKIDLTWASENQIVWFMLPEDDPSGEACCKALIVKLVDEENVQIRMEGSQETKNIKGDKIYPLNNYRDFPEGYDDMVDIEHLSEAELLNNIRIRFEINMIYTYVGPTLIVLNPYKTIDKLVGPNILKRFQKALLEGRFEQKEHMPHVYAISATTMRNLIENNKNQAIVISGESGAGKTENTKSAMKFFTSLGNLESIDNKIEENIEDKILACNPVLEAFGNAKTVRNDNSSRFGKYVALLVEKGTKKIIGATITNYLLEKSRVITQTMEERNYHIFYAFLRGASQDNLKKYFLTNKLEDWEFLKNAFRGEVKTVPDVELYKEVVDSFNTMKFTEIEQHTIWSYTAASLMIGNIDFDESEFSDTIPCKLKNEQFLKNAAKLLNVDFQRFSKSLIFKTRIVAGSTIDSTIKRDECIIYRDSLAKELFNKLFNWIVKRLNFTVMPPEFTKGDANLNTLMNKYYHIGLLDIFGFEIFKVNSLEQFCINFANEKLQQLYIAYVFKGEEREFINEGLKEFLCELTFKDNQNLIDMIDSVKIPGIFQMIDEACSVATTDQNLYEKILKQLKKPEFPLTTPKIARDTFIVKHTAKEVEYNINGFRAKNKDEISKTIEDTICSSGTVDIVKVWKNLCFDEIESEEAKNIKPNPKDKFLGYKFRTQMRELMEELNSCECHFIRCLKPNEKKQPDFFVPQLVLQQIKYMGVLDTIKVRKESFPVRINYKFFYEKYQELDAKNSKIPFQKHVDNGADFKEIVKGICQKKVPHLGTNMILFGNNKIFLRVEAAKELEKLRREIEKKKVKAAKMFQNAWLYYKKINLWRNMTKGIKAIQKIFKINKEYINFGKKRRSTRKIQIWWKSFLNKRKLENMNKMSTVIQRWWKMKFYCKKYLEKINKTKLINRVMRGAISRKRVKLIKYCKSFVEEIINNGAKKLIQKNQTKAAHIIQKYAKGYLCRKKLSYQIEQIKKAKEMFVKNKMARIIQKHTKGMIVRKAILRMNRSATLIQGYLKMKWLSSLFQQLRRVAVIIQKTARRWLIRRKAVREMMQNYMLKEGKNYKFLQIAEQANLFGIKNIEKVSKAIERQSPTSKGPTTKKPQEQKELFNNKNTSTFASRFASTQKDELIGIRDYDGIINPEEFNQATLLNTTKAFDPYASKKISLLTKIIDIDPLSDTSLIYDPMWSLQTLQLQNLCFASNADISLIELGQAHTTIVTSAGKTHSFGWNDVSQLGRPTLQTEIASCGQIDLFNENFRLKSIANGDDHNLAVDYQGNLYVWGDNSKGQLGLGHSQKASGITVLDFLTHDTIQEVKAKGENSLVVTQNGKVFCWPRKMSSGENFFSPTEMNLPSKIQITTAACGSNFAVLVSKNGCLFTFGRDNQAGQLGHNDLSPRETPTLVETLKNEGEIIIGVSCGYKHVICKSKSGKAFTWGWGKKGQLGHGTSDNELKPKLLSLDQNSLKAKVAQVQAGYCHSVILLDNKKVFWCGTNGSLEFQHSLAEIDLQEKIPDCHKDFIPLKVLCAWSKTMNVTYITMADTRAVDLSLTMKQKVISILSNKIEENYAFHDADLPYVEAISKYFSIKAMNKKNPSNSTKISVNRRSTKPNDAGIVPSYCESLVVLRGSPRNNNEGAPYQSQESNYQSLEKPSPLSNFLTTKPKNYTQQPDSQQKFQKQGFSSENKLTSESSISSKSPLSKIDATSHSLLQASKSQLSKSDENDKEKFAKIIGTSSTSLFVKSQTVNKRIDNPYARENRPSDQNQQNALNQKLYEIKKRMQEIIVLPMEKWTKTDAELIKMATEPKMLGLLQNIKI